MSSFDRHRSVCNNTGRIGNDDHIELWPTAQAKLHSWTKPLTASPQTPDEATTPQLESGAKAQPSNELTLYGSEPACDCGLTATLLPNALVYSERRNRKNREQGFPVT